MGSIVQAASLDTLAALRKFLEDWADSSARVRSIVNWEYSAKALCEKSRPGAFLCDCMVTEAMVRKGGRKNVHYHVAHNDTFQTIAQSLRMTKSMNANNAGNVLEALCWVAFEEGKPLWTVALAWHAVRLQWEDHTIGKKAQKEQEVGPNARSRGASREGSRIAKAGCHQCQRRPPLARRLPPGGGSRSAVSGQ